MQIPELLPAYQQPVGVFDSGLGGLSVLTGLLSVLPRERFVYLADEAKLPYGTKPQHEIVARSHQIARFMQQWPCKAFVIACNTATAAAAQSIRQLNPSWPVVGIEPAVKPASLMTHSGVVGILATQNTVASERFRALVERFDPLAKVVAVPCNGLVELIESVPIDRVAVRELLRPIISALTAQGVDVLVLGCTHYPFVEAEIRSLAGPGVEVLHTGLPVARQLARRLEEAQLLRPQATANDDEIKNDTKRVIFLTTGNATKFRDKVVELLGVDWADSDFQSVTMSV